MKDRRGSVGVFAALSIISVFIVLGATIEVVKAYTLASAVKTYVSEAVVATAADNYYNIYTGIREGNSTGDFFDDEAWNSSVLSTDLQNRLESILVLEGSGAELVNSSGGVKKLSINDLKLTYEGVSKQADNSQVLNFKATFEIEMPLSLGGVTLSPLKLKQSVSSTFMPLY